jgi:energy-coupling factor transporter ATP-binding protein EcfA2
MIFGRKGESEEIVEKLVRNRFIALTGASGSGKSSLIHCGVIPGIKTRSIKGKSSWRIFSIKPGNNPFGSLADAFVETSLNSGQKTVRREEILNIR